MPKSKFLFVLLFLLTTTAALAQTLTISGTVKSAADNTSLPGATVIAERQAASALSLGMITDFDGKFTLEKVEPGNYLLKIQFVGYQPVTKTIEVGEKDVALGVILLLEDTQTLDEIQVTAQAMMSEQKGDTSVFNASAFKTIPNASAEELVQKMPGIAMVDGKIQAQGEDVQQILIDGKPFFGEDVQAALQSLPADVIASVEVFDRRSDQAELSGFDDGQRIKTINIVTKPNRRRGQFGKTSVGVGTDERYLAGSNVNLFNGDRRISITGLSNNINILNYSANPGANAESLTQDAIINNNAVAVSFADTWLKTMEISGSYLYNNRKDETIQSRFRDYVLPSDSGQVYSENSLDNARDNEHRIFVRADYKINEKNRVLWRPTVSFRNNIRNSSFSGATESDSGPINETQNASSYDLLDYDFFNRLLYNHQFDKEGRGFTVNLNTSYNLNGDDSYRTAENNYYLTAGDSLEVLRQNMEWSRNGSNWSARGSYTEPLGKNGRVELEYTYGNRLNDSDRRLYNYSEQLNDYTDLDVALSNTFDNSYTTQEVEIGYSYINEKLTAQVEMEYQDARLNNNQQFPRETNLKRTFNSFLPFSRVEYKFSEHTNLELNYRAWTTEPSVDQLQDVVNNANPLQLRTGNPALNQAINNWVRARVRSNNPETNKSFFVNAQTMVTDDYIGTSTFIAEEAVTVGEGVVLEKGSQLTKPVNLAGYREFRSYFSYGQPIGVLKTNINLNGGVNYTSRPGLINDELNLSNSSNYRLGVSLSSNISEKIDFRISTWGRYNVVKNTLRPTLNNNFYNQTTRFLYNWIIGDSFTFRTDLNYQLNSGLSEGFDNSFVLWNMSMGKKVLKNKMGEISLNVYDLLKQNNNIRRNVSEIFIEDIQSNVLNRYVMVSFTYNFKRFSGGASEEDFEEIESD